MRPTSVDAYCRANSRVAIVDRRMSNLETTSPARAATSATGAGASHRPSRRSIESAARGVEVPTGLPQQRRRGSTRSFSTRSMTPRDGFVTGTSSSRPPARDPAPRRTASSIGAWNRSWSRGPEPGKYRRLRSAPSATPMAVRTSMLGLAVPDSSLAQREVRPIYPDDLSKSREGNADIESHPTDVLARLESEASHPSCGFASDFGPRDGHGRIEAGRRSSGTYVDPRTPVR